VPGSTSIRRRIMSIIISFNPHSAPSTGTVDFLGIGTGERVTFDTCNAYQGWLIPNSQFPIPNSQKISGVTVQGAECEI
jgi:hypothetical protein